MKAALYDVDSHRWPNLCLMKLSAYHKARGDSVEWWRPDGYYDRVYKSRVFTDTYSKDTITVTNASEVICGGTGYGPGPNLPDEVEHMRPDYSIYPLPMAVMQGREFIGMKQNYLKSLLALSFQASLIMIYVMIYVVLVRNISGNGDIIGAIWTCMSYCPVLLYPF